MIGDDIEDEYSYSLHMSGHATTLGEEDEECEAVRLLHDAIAEVTGKRPEPKPKQRIGFY